MKKVLSIFLFSFLFLSSSIGQSDEAYAKSLKKMFSVSGTEETYQAAIKQMIDIFRQRSPEVDESIWKDFENEFAKTSIDELVELFMPVYQKYLSREDIEGIIQFYQSPVGQKYAKSIPMITQESMQIGQQWGMEIGQKITKKLEEKGY